MLSAKDIRAVKFSKSVGGYKQEEVDVLLDRVEVDYDQYERTVRELQARVDNLSREIDGYKNSQNSLQNVLLSAQKLADQIVDEARVKSEEIVAAAQQKVEDIAQRERDLSAEFAEKANRRREELTYEVETAVRKAEAKTASIETAATDAVSRQQILFEKLKLDVSAFKTDIIRRYREHLELLQKLPDEVPLDPKQAAEAVAAVIDQAPDVTSYIRQPEPVDAPAGEPADQPTGEETPTPAAPPAQESGFVVEDVVLSDQTEEE